MKVVLLLGLFALLCGYASCAFIGVIAYGNTACSDPALTASFAVANCTITPGVCQNQTTISIKETCVDTVTAPTGGSYVLAVFYSGDSTCTNATTITSYSFSALDVCLPTGQFNLKTSFNGTHFLPLQCSDSACQTCIALPAQLDGTCMPGGPNFYIKTTAVGPSPTPSGPGPSGFAAPIMTVSMGVALLVTLLAF